MSDAYETFINLLTRRRSIRKFKPDPLPEGTIEKILEAGRWAMSGANGQPWEFIVVTDRFVKQALFELYRDQIDDYNFWLEQMRAPDLRHPAFQLTGSADEQREKLRARPSFAEAPALIVVLGVGRRQWKTVMGAHAGASPVTSQRRPRQCVHAHACSRGGSRTGLTVDDDSY